MFSQESINYANIKIVRDRKETSKHVKPSVSDTVLRI